MGGRERNPQIRNTQNIWAVTIMKRQIISLSIMVILVVSTGFAQDIPGFGIGLFYDSLIEDQWMNEDITCRFMGGRIAFRDERYIEVFADFGNQELEMEDADIDSTFGYGLGFKLWILRDQDLQVPLDIGLTGSYHIAEYDLPDDSNLKHSDLIIQAMLRADYNLFRPFIFAGILKTNYDFDDVYFDMLADEEDLNDVKPAIKAGLEFELTQQAILSFHANYNESISGGVNFNFWF